MIFFKNEGFDNHAIPCNHRYGGLNATNNNNEDARSVSQKRKCEEVMSRVFVRYAFSVLLVLGLAVDIFFFTYIMEIELRYNIIR